MKKQFSPVTVRATGSFNDLRSSNNFTRNTVFILSLVVLSGIFLFTGCKKQDGNSAAEPLNNNSLITSMEFRNTNGEIEGLTLWELQQARAATAKYQHISKAMADGYGTINLPVPNMGHHYMKSGLVDSVFDIRKPELLVYNRDDNGVFQLVAVEYAVLIDSTRDVAPAGFTGNSDVWDRNADFGMWLLHAWVWHHNPDGVFNPTNPLIHLH